MNASVDLIFNQEFITILIAISAVIMAVTAKIVDSMKAASKAMKIFISFVVSALVAGLMKLIGVFGTWALLDQFLDDLPVTPDVPVSAPNSFYVILGVMGFIMANGLYDLIKNFIRK